MRIFLIILLFAAFSCSSDYVEVVLEEQCRRLIEDDYPDPPYPRDDCLCFVDAEYNVVYALSNYEFQKRSDSFYCGLRVEYKPDYVHIMITGSILVSGDTITCDCK